MNSSWPKIYGICGQKQEETLINWTLGHTIVNPISKEKLG